MRAWNPIQLLFIVVALGSSLTVPSIARDFTDDQGRVISADLTGVHGDNAELSKGGKRFIFPIAKLSAEDQKFVTEWAKANKTFKLAFKEIEIEDTNKRRTQGSKKGGDMRKFQTRKFQVEITNLSGIDLENLVVEYNFATRTTKFSKDIQDGKPGRAKNEWGKTFTGKHKIDRIEHSRSSTFSTGWQQLQDREWEVEKTYTNGIDTFTHADEYKINHQLDGIWLKVKLEGRVIAEWVSDGKHIKEIAWKNPK